MRLRSKDPPRNDDHLERRRPRSFVDDPDHADAVATAIHDVVVSVRTGEPLNGP